MSMLVQVHGRATSVCWRGVVVELDGELAEPANGKQTTTDDIIRT
jgi:hypothetical protein